MPFRVKGRKGWQGQVRHQGKLYRADFPTKHQAADWEARKRKELNQGTQSKTRTGMDLLDFCNKYLDHAELRFTKKVFKEKKALCETLIERWKDIEVQAVTPEMVNEYLAEQAKKRSNNAHNKDRKNLLAMWNWGLKIVGLPNNPVALIDKLPHDRKPQYTPPTVDMLKVLATAKREERVLLSCYIQTAARRSEIFRWTWVEDINFEKRQIRLGTRKTRDGSMEYEWLRMSDELYDDLWWWWNNRTIKESPYVFVSTSNRYYGQPFTTRRQFVKGLCKRAGVKEFNFHALRRYVASFLADTQKVSAKSIQRLLRHKNVTTTERYIQNIDHDMEYTVNLLKTKSSQEELTKHDKELDNNI